MSRLTDIITTPIPPHVRAGVERAAAKQKLKQQLNGALAQLGANDVTAEQVKASLLQQWGVDAQ